MFSVHGSVAKVESNDLRTWQPSSRSRELKT